MIRIRRWAALVGLGVIGLLLAGRGMGQVIQTPVPPANTGAGSGSAAGFSSVKIVEDSHNRQVINVGRDCIKDQDWTQAVKALQTILNQEEDSYVQVREPDPFDTKKEIARWTSVKFEANNLIGAVPLFGLQAY